ncbi:hypothetical protein PT2222_50010 [Paraburkholderia tropica]
MFVHCAAGNVQEIGDFLKGEGTFVHVLHSLDSQPGDLLDEQFEIVHSCSRALVFDERSQSIDRAKECGNVLRTDLNEIGDTTDREIIVGKRGGLAHGYFRMRLRRPRC